MNELPLIDVFIINYNGKNTILSTIESLYNSENIAVNITVIDDHSTDESPEMIKKCYPGIPIHVMPSNTKRANILRNKAMQMAKTEYFFISDNDIKYDRHCLSEMLKVMQADPAVASCTPRLMYWDQPDKVYIAGISVHYIGAAISDQRDKPFDQRNIKPSMNSGSGICLLRRETAIHTGGFDVNLLQGWGSDGEFYQRMLRAGHKCLYVPTAFGLHEDKLQITTRKFRAVGATYNRWVFMLSHYSIPLLLLLTPMLLMYEIFQLAFVIMKGIFTQYIKGNLLVIRNLPLIISKRKQVQKLKIVSDKKVVFAGNLYVAPALLEKNPLIKFVVFRFSDLLSAYWSIIKRIVP